MDLQDVIDISLLQKVQDTFAEATGFATVIVDFRGNPITKYSKFSPFCKLVRKDPQFNHLCLKCDAHGGLEAARKETPYVYQCHTGLVDFAVPIVVKGHLLGSMLAGQVKMDASDIDKPNYITHEFSFWEENEEMKKEYTKIRVTSYEKIKAVAEMMFFVINNIFEKDIIQQYVHEELYVKVQEVDQLKVMTGLEKELKGKQEQELLPILDTQFLLNTMNTLSCLAIIEKAPQTQEVILTLTDMMQYTISTIKQHLVPLRDEIEYIGKLLELLNLRFESLHTSVNIPEEHHSIQIPPLILQFIINYIVRYSIEPQGGEGNISINGLMEEDCFFVEITIDSTNNFKEKTAEIHEGINHQQFEKENMEGNLHNNILVSPFGEYKLIITQTFHEGITGRLIIPRD